VIKTPLFSFPAPPRKKQKRTFDTCYNLCYTYSMKCKQCGSEIEQIGNRIKEYCSDKCRMAFKRSNPNIQSEQIQSEQHKKVQSEQKEIIDIIPGDEWRRDYLEEHAQKFKENYENTKDCTKCIEVRSQFSRSRYSFCPTHAKYVR